jgi:TonB family protein
MIILPVLGHHRLLAFRADSKRWSLSLIVSNVIQRRCTGQRAWLDAFSIDPKGNIVRRRIDETSGSAALDAEALAMIKRAGPLPAPPTQVADADLAVVRIRFTGREQR